MAKDLSAFLTRLSEDTAFAEEAMEKSKSIAAAGKISDDKMLTVRVGKEMGYEFTLDDINRTELKIEENEAAGNSAVAKDMQTDMFELDPESLAAVAGGCNDTSNPHDWKCIGKEKGILWGYNLRFRCTKCREEKAEWEKWPWE